MRSSGAPRKTASAPLSANATSPSVIMARQRSKVERVPALSERDHAPDPIPALHQLESAVDFVERDPVRDESIHVELAVELQLHQLGHLVASLDASER